MIRENWNQVVQKQEVRQNLSKIRQEIKNKGKLEDFISMIAGEEELLIGLLDSEDAKTRKNAALLMGDIGKQVFMEPIWLTYQKEEQQFVKSSYLTAIGNFDYRKHLKELKDHLDLLSHLEVAEENQKHLVEEMRELSSLVVRMEGVTAHKFIGWNEKYDIMMLTNRNFAEITRDELLNIEPNAKTKLVGAGVMASVDNLNWISQIRTYQELLFMVKGMEACVMEPYRVAEMIVKSNLFDFLSKSHQDGQPYYFRVEMKSRRGLDEKSAFAKKLSSQIERLSKRTLINTTANYEIELRVIENKEGNCNILLKLFTLKDERFSYRKEVVPTSIKPVNAALTVALAKEYLKEDAQILDPFCGVGTMLVERHKSVNAKTTYGVDLQEDAILKARVNTEAASQIVHYINRDFFRFKHEYLFDEIITNMPFRIGRITDEEVYETYEQFFNTVSNHLNKDAILILYSHNIELVKMMASKNIFRLLKEYEISKREGTYVLILQYIN